MYFEKGKKYKTVTIIFYLDMKFPFGLDVGPFDFQGNIINAEANSPAEADVIHSKRLRLTMEWFTWRNSVAILERLQKEEALAQALPKKNKAGM